MELDRNTCYRAVQSRDRRFDGWFFVGVSSTGIYCRPVCAVRTPKFENCHFFPSAAAAEKQGFRPCLRCRPELAPGHGLFDASSRLAQAAALLIDDGYLNQAGVTALAARIGITERHLRRIFAAEFGVSPIEYAQTQRLLMAKRLLTDTALPVTEIALASGFGSVRRFNSLFKTHYGFSPTRLRQAQPDTRRAASECVTFELGYRPPLAWKPLLDFLARRVVTGVEIVDPSRGIYRRAIALAHGPRTLTGWIAVENVPARHMLRVSMPASLVPILPQVLGKVRRLFDLGCRPDVIDRHLGALAADVPGMRVPGAFDGFEIAARAIAGQQVTLAHARRVLAYLTQHFGTPLAVPADGLTHAFPQADALAGASLDALIGAGLIRARAAALQAVARAVADGTVCIEPLAPLDATLNALRAIRGIGDWTAQYIAMRGLSWPDAFPAGDYVLKKQLGLNSESAVAHMAEQWAPWRAYAALHVWHRHQEMHP